MQTNTAFSTYRVPSRIELLRTAVQSAPSNTLPKRACQMRKHPPTSQKLTAIKQLLVQSLVPNNRPSILSACQTSSEVRDEFSSIHDRIRCEEPGMSYHGAGSSTAVKLGADKLYRIQIISCCVQAAHFCTCKQLRSSAEEEPSALKGVQEI